MKTNRKAALLAFLALVLAFTVVSCSDPGHKTNAEVRVVGTAVSEARSVASELQFGSGEVWLGGNDITSSLVPAEGSNATDGQNNAEFVAEVPVIGETVTYSVKHEYGFVFDEWEIVNRNKIRLGEGDNWWNVLNEIWQATRGDSETIEIRPEYIKYIRPSFDRGIYVKSGENIGEKLKEYYSKSWNYDDDELTIKLEEGEFVLDLSEIKPERGEDEIELELKIIGGYDPSSWNITNRSTISEIKLPQSGGYIEEVELELELEFRNISFAELDYNAFRTKDDFEIEFSNCSVKTLKNARGIINGLMVKTIEKAQTGRALLIMNSVAPYVEGAWYYHSVVMNGDGKTVDGKNNIIVGVSGDSDNYYVASWNENSYKTDDPELIDNLIQANPLSENFLEGLEDHFDDMDDDFLEEDIEGRERFLIDDDEPGSRGIKVSYGPYEYQWFDD